MLYNVDFELTGILCVLIIYIALSLYYSKQTEVNRKFSLLVLSVLSTEILDVATAFTISYGESIPPAINTALNTIYFASAFSTGYAFLRYTESYVYQAKQKTRNIQCNRIVFFIFLVFLFLNIFVGFFFSFNENGEYIHGDLYLLVYAVPLYYICYALGVMLRHRRMFKTKQMVSGIVYIVMAALGPLMQMLFFPDILLSLFSCSIALLIILFSMETPDYQMLMKTLAELDELQKNLQQEVKKQTRKAENRAEDLAQLSGKIVLTLAETIDAKDKYTSGHSERVADYSVRIAQRMGFTEDMLKKIYYMGLLHDIGKIGVPDAVINKAGKLTDEEFELIKMHPSVGEDILKNITKIPDISIGAKFHHEKYDGSGYPNRVSGEDIPLSARIIGIADAYDAMTSRRSYRDALPQEVVRNEILKGKGTQFDPKCADIMLSMIDEDTEYQMRDTHTNIHTEAFKIKAVP